MVPNSHGITALTRRVRDIFNEVRGQWSLLCEMSALEMDYSPINQNFELNKSGQIFHHSLKEHHKISNIPKFRCKML
jgi:hypothetical protein